MVLDAADHAEPLGQRHHLAVRVDHAAGLHGRVAPVGVVAGERVQPLDARRGGMLEALLEPLDLLGPIGGRGAGEVVARDQRGDLQAQPQRLGGHLLQVPARVGFVHVAREDLEAVGAEPLDLVDEAQQVDLAALEQRAVAP